MATITFRDNTKDWDIFTKVYVENRYGFPEDMTGVTMLDIGAQIGSASMACTKRGARVIAFEPYKESFDLLVKNTKGMDVECHRVAIGEPGIRKLYHNVNNLGSNSLYNEWEDLKDVGGEDVKVISIEPYLKNTWVKMDCEGAEREIFPKLLKHHTKMIFCEIHQDVGGWLDLLRQQYKVISISDCEFRMIHK